MVFNIMLDFALGLVPLIGDIADAIYRANTRNAWLLEVYLTKKAEAERTGHVSDPELGKLSMPHHQQGTIQEQHMPNQPEPARVKSRPEPVRSQSGPRNGFPVNTNGKIRRPDAEMAMAALDYGVRAMNSQSTGHGHGHGQGFNGSGGRGGSNGYVSNGRSTPRTKEDLAMAALQYGARAALDAHNGRSKSAGPGGRVR